MSHVRKQIKDAFQSALAAGLPGYDVFSSRKYARNVLARPMIDMRFLNENVDLDTMGPTRRRTSSLYIRVQRSAPEAQLDDLLDADEVAVNDVIMAVDWRSLLEETPELKQVNWSDASEGGDMIGAIVLRYDVEYRVDQDDFETVRA